MYPLGEVCATFHPTTYSITYIYWQNIVLDKVIRFNTQEGVIELVYLLSTVILQLFRGVTKDRIGLYSYLINTTRLSHQNKTRYKFY